MQLFKVKQFGWLLAPPSSPPEIRQFISQETCSYFIRAFISGEGGKATYWFSTGALGKNGTSYVTFNKSFIECLDGRRARDRETLASVDRLDGVPALNPLTSRRLRYLKPWISISKLLNYNGPKFADNTGGGNENQLDWLILNVNYRHTGTISFVCWWREVARIH